MSRLIFTVLIIYSAAFNLELVINGDFEEWYWYRQYFSDVWTIYDTLTASAAMITGRTGYGLEANALDNSDLCKAENVLGGSKREQPSYRGLIKKKISPESVLDCIAEVVGLEKG